MPMNCRGVIVGAGIIGSAIAYELSRLGESDLVVVDPDLLGSLSSTERNAGGVRHLWQHRINFELSRHSIDLFEKIKESVGFHQTGYLWLVSNAGRESGEAIFSKAKTYQRGYEQWSLKKIKDHYPFIDKTDDLAFAIFGSRDGLINANALKNYYRTEAKKKGVKFLDRLALTSLALDKGKPRLELTRFHNADQALNFIRNPEAETKASEPFDCEYAVLCAGPWMASLLPRLGHEKTVRPIRRQISFFKAETFDMSPYGMVVDTSHVYFHPEGGNILSGLVLKAEREGYFFDYDPSFFEQNIWPPLFERSTHFERLKHISGWAGLYSYTSDTTGILGKLPPFENVYEAHSFTGRGVMQSYGVAISLAELILNKRFTTIDAKSLSRQRFALGKEAWLHEELHI